MAEPTSRQFDLILDQATSLLESNEGQTDSMKHDKHRWYSWLLKVPKLHVAKRIIVGVIGGTVTLIGIALIVLPGPAFIVIPIGLSILATEFLWAKRWLRKAREVVTRVKKKA